MLSLASSQELLHRSLSGDTEQEGSSHPSSPTPLEKHCKRWGNLCSPELEFGTQKAKQDTPFQPLAAKVCDCGCQASSRLDVCSSWS